MLKALVTVLLLANLAFFAWTLGWFDGFIGVRSIGDREPERFERQVRPEMIRVLPPGAATAAEEAPVAVLACFEAGPFADAELPAAQAAAQGLLPAGGWKTITTLQPGAWMVYMGRFATPDALTKKEEELARRQLAYELVITPPSLAPGLSLGRFEQRDAAAQALDQWARQGVRTARVVELAAAANQHLLRVDKAPPALAAQLAALKPTPGLGKGFGTCKSAG